MDKGTAATLIAAATPLFAQKGFTAVTIREIADAAQINSSAISYYFGSKEGLYQAIIETHFAPVAAFLTTVETNLPRLAKDRIVLYAKTVGEVHGSKPFLTRIVISELANPTECGAVIIQKYIGRFYQFIHTALAYGQQTGEFRSDLNIKHAVVALAGIMNFYFLANPLVERLPHEAGESPAGYVTQAVKIYLEGIEQR